MFKDLNDVEVRGAPQPVEQEPEKAILVGVELPSSQISLSSSMDELERLANTAGVESIARTTQRLSSPHPATFIGSGKVEEVALLARELGADVIIFDDELTPSQQSNLERLVDKNIKVIDRTALILDIFALHATSREGRLQVRLAQNQYLYPRLRGMWAHLASNRMGGGVGSRFGEGESQLEVDRRMVRKRITSIKEELKRLARIRELQREERYASGMFKVSLAGYTNAGKSSLLNRLCDADVYSDDKLFATLDSTTRRLRLPEGRAITLTDTVGFIQKLPTTLIEAFKSTLDEINGSDLILHIVDISSDSFRDQMDAVHETLEQIDAQRIGRITVFNKIDALETEMLQALQRRYPHAVFVSALTGQGIVDLLERMSAAAAAEDIMMEVVVPYSSGELVSLAHNKCSIISEEFNYNGTKLTMRVPRALANQFKPYENNADEAGS